MTSYTHRYSITAADIDTRYRMMPNAVLMYYQDCWARYMAQLKMAAYDIARENMIWIISEFDARFESQPAYWSQDIEVAVWNSELTAVRCYAEFSIRLTDGTDIAHGYGCWTLLDMTTHRLLPLSALPYPMPSLPEKMTTESHRKMRFNDEGTLLQQIDHIVNPLNLDMNGHVNNRTYLALAMQSANEAFMDAHAISRIVIHWTHETFIGDTLRCVLNLLPREQEDGTYVYVHTMLRYAGQNADNRDSREGECKESSEPQLAAQIYSEWQKRNH